MGASSGYSVVLILISFFCAVVSGNVIDSDSKLNKFEVGSGNIDLSSEATFTENVW